MVEARWTSAAIVAIVSLQFPLLGEEAQAQGPPPSGVLVTDGQIREWLFPRDGAQTPDDVDDLENPIDRRSVKGHEFDTSLGQARIVAIGAQRSAEDWLLGSQAHNRRFQTTLDPLSVISNGKLGVDSPGDTVQILVVCRLSLSGQAAPCSNLNLGGKVGASGYTSDANLEPIDMLASGAGTPTFDPDGASSRYAFPPAWAAFNSAAQWGNTASATRFDAETFSVFIVRLRDPNVATPAVPGAAIGGAGDPARSPPRVAFFQGTFSNAAGGGAVATLREPLWRTAAGDPADDQPLRFCGQKWPGLANVTTYKTLGSAAAVAIKDSVKGWMASCQPVDGGTLYLEWPTLMLDPGFVGALDDASRNDDESLFAETFRQFVADRFAFAVTPRLSFVGAFPASCSSALGSALPCLRYLVPSEVAVPELLSVDVLDNNTWRPAAKPTDVYGGWTHVRFNLSNAFWSMAALPTGFDAASAAAGSLVFTIYISPGETDTLTAAAEIIDPGNRFRSGVIASAPQTNALGVPGSLPARPSTIPLIETPGDGPTSAFLAHWQTSTEEALEACVHEVYSHSNHGAVTNTTAGLAPNFMVNGSVADRFAFGGQNQTSCFAITDFIRLVLPQLSLGVILVVKTGDRFGVQMEVPHLLSQEALENWSRGIDVRRGWNVPLSTLMNSTAPWEEGGALYDLMRIRSNATIPRVTVTLPITLPPEILASTAFLIIQKLDGLVLSVFVAIDNLPLTLLVERILGSVNDPQPSELPIFVSAGALPLSTWEGPNQLHPYQRLNTIWGLAAHPSVITVGAGDLTDGVADWSRMGPTATLLAKPDFLAPPLMKGETAGALLGLIPLVEMIHLGGFHAATAMRALLASLALPYEGAPIHTFYMQGFGVLDVTQLLPPGVGLPSLDELIELAEGALSYVPMSYATPVEAHELTGTDKSASHSHAAAVPVGPNIYLFGGYGSDKILRFNVAAKTLVDTGHRLPQAVNQPSAASVGDSVFVFGGGTDRIVRYDVATGSVTTLATRLPGPRLGMAATVHGSAVYLFGGFESGAFKTQILRFDPTTLEIVAVGNLPQKRSEGAAFADGTYLYVTGGREAPGLALTSVVRFDPATGAVETLSGSLGEARVPASAVWERTTATAYVFGARPQGGTTRPIVTYNTMTESSGSWAGAPALSEVVAAAAGATVFLFGNGKVWEFSPGRIDFAGPPGLHGPTEAILDPSNVASPAALVGATLPPGALDPIQFGTVLQLHVDTPVLPGTLFTDWGVTDHKFARPANLKLLDIEPLINLTVRPLNDIIQAIDNVTDVLGPLDPIRGPLATIEAAGPDKVDIETSHFYLFDFFAHDFVFGAQALLLENATLDNPHLPDGDPVQDLVEGAKALLPPEYWLVQQLYNETVEAEAELGGGFICPDLSDIYGYVYALRTYLIETTDALMSIRESGPLENVSFDIDPTLPMPPDVQQRVNRACEKVFSDLVAYLEELRTRIEDLREFQDAIDDAAPWASKYLDPPPTAVTYSLLDATATALGLPGVANNTTATFLGTTVALEAQIDGLINMLEDLVLRLISSRFVDSEQPIKSILSVPAVTQSAPLGPYMGLTLVTTRDVEVRNPFTGDPIAKRNITVPIPSLLWNSPELFVRMQFRDGMAIPEQGLTIHKPGYSVFNRFAIRPTVEVDGLRVPLMKNLAQALRDGAPGGLEPFPLPMPFPGNPTADLRAAINKTISEIHNKTQDPGDIANDLAKQIDALVLHLVELVLGALFEIVEKETNLSGYLATIYSHSKKHGGRSNDDGMIRSGEVFPASYARSYPYSYGTLHELTRNYPYADVPTNLQDDAADWFADADYSIHEGLRRSIADEDGTEQLDEAPRVPSFQGLDNPWGMLQPGLELAVNRTTSTWWPNPVYEVHGDRTRAYHQFGLEHQAGLDPYGLTCLSVASRNALLGLLFDSPFVNCLMDPPRVWLPSFDDLIELVCSFVGSASNCVVGVEDALNETLSGNAPEPNVTACADTAGDLMGCGVVLDAIDMLSTLLRSVDIPMPEIVQNPMMFSFTHTIRDNEQRLMLDEANLSEWILQENGLTNTTENASRALAAATEILANLSTWVKSSMSIIEPARTSHDQYSVAQALKGHGTDKVAGYHWASASFPPDPRDPAYFELMVDLAGDSVNDIQNRTVRTWARNLVSRLEPPQAGHGIGIQFPIDTGSGGSAGTRVPRTPATSSWLPRSVSGAVNITPPDVVDVVRELADIEEDVSLSLGVEIGRSSAQASVHFNVTDPAPNVRASARLWAASILEHLYAQDATPSQAVWPLMAAVGNASTWQVDRTVDAIRASSTTLSPKVGVFSYTVPLPPQELVTLRTKGSYYFQNTDALLIVTPYDFIRDAVLAMSGNITARLNVTSDPAVRPLNASLEIDAGLARIMQEINITLDESPGFDDEAPAPWDLEENATEAEPDPWDVSENETEIQDRLSPLVNLHSKYLRIRHLNPSVQVEDEGDNDPIIVRVGGPRVKYAGDLFEFRTRGQNEGEQPFGFDEMHFIYVYFPIIDSSNLVRLENSLRASGAEEATIAASEALLREAGSKFIIQDYGVMWDSYIGFKHFHAYDFGFADTNGNGRFDGTEPLYLDQDDDGYVAPNDLRVVGDYGAKVQHDSSDVNRSLLDLDFADICYVDLDESATYTPGEPVYLVTDQRCNSRGKRFVRPGNFRITPYGPYAAGTTAGNFNADLLLPFRSLAASGFRVLDVDGNGLYGAADAVFLDVDDDGRLEVGDIRITSSAGGPPGSLVLAADPEYNSTTLRPDVPFRDTPTGESGGESLEMPLPWNQRIEDLKLYWATPSTAWPPGPDYSFTANVRDGRAKGPTLHASSLDMINISPAQDGAYRFWGPECTETYAPGKWYGPYGYPDAGKYWARGVGLGGNAFLGTRGHCEYNEIENLMPAKKKYEFPGVVEHVFEQKPKSVYSGLAYDFNTPMTHDWETHSKLLWAPKGGVSISCFLCLHNSIRLNVTGPVDELLGTLRGDLLEDEMVTPAIRIIDGTTDFANDALGSADTSLVTRLVTLPLLGTLEYGGLTLARSYVPRVQFGLGAGLNVSYWGVLNEDDFHAMTAGLKPGGTLLLEDDTAFVPGRPYHELADLPDSTEHEWFPLTQPVDPARLVLASGLDVGGAGGQPRYHDGLASVAVVDGFLGQGIAEGLSIRIPDEIAIHDASSTVDAHVKGSVGISKWVIGVALGGSATNKQELVNGTLQRSYTSDISQCWRLPLGERVFRHAMCWQGEWGQLTNAALLTQASIACQAPLRAFVDETAIGVTDTAKLATGRTVVTADGMLWPLYADLKPPSTVPAEQAISFSTAAILPVADNALRLIKCSADANVDSAIGGDVDEMLGNVRTSFGPAIPYADCRSAVLAGRPGCAPVIVGDLYATLPLPLKQRYLPIRGFPLAPQPAYDAQANSGPGVREISVTWSPPPGDVVGFEVHRRTATTSFALVDIVDPTSDAFVDEGLTPYVHYTYKVVSLYAKGRGAPSAEVTAQPAAAPMKPQNVTVTYTLQDHVRVEWDQPEEDGGGPVSTYTVQLSMPMTGPTQTPSNWGFPRQVNGDERALEFDREWLSGDRWYHARVQATNSFGVSGYQNTLTPTYVPNSAPLP